MNCQSCGKCCVESPLLELLPSDILRLKQRFPNFEQDYVDHLKIFNLNSKIPCIFLVMNQKPCIFLEEKTKKCSIYAYRPNICREFPLKFGGFSWIEMTRPFDQRRKNLLNFFITLCNCERIISITPQDIEFMSKIVFASEKEKERISWQITEEERTEINEFAEKAIESYENKKDYPLIHFIEQQNNPRFAEFLLLFDSYFEHSDEQQAEYREFTDEFANNMRINQDQAIEQAIIKLKEKIAIKREKGL